MLESGSLRVEAGMRAIILIADLPHDRQQLRALEHAVVDHRGIRQAVLSPALGKAYVEFDESRLTVEAVRDEITSSQAQIEVRSAHRRPPAPPGRVDVGGSLPIALSPGGPSVSTLIGRVEPPRRSRGGWKAPLVILGAALLLLMSYVNLRAVVVACSALDATTAAAQPAQVDVGTAAACPTALSTYGGSRYVDFAHLQAVYQQSRAGANDTAPSRVGDHSQRASGS
jgi:hypothetical protein